MDSIYCVSFTAVLEWLANRQHVLTESGIPQETAAQYVIGWDPFVIDTYNFPFYDALVDVLNCESLRLTCNPFDVFIAEMNLEKAYLTEIVNRCYVHPTETTGTTEEPPAPVCEVCGVRRTEGAVFHTICAWPQYLYVCNRTQCRARMGTCGYCGDQTSVWQGGERHDETFWTCRSCNIHCRQCGDRIAPDSAHEHNDRNYCETCYEDVCTVLSHDANVLDYFPFLGSPKDLIFYGIELEVEPRESHSHLRIELAKDVKDIFDGYAIVKHDGSLVNGFEIVTVPATPEIHAEKWKMFTEHKLPLESWDSPRCGMHVHFSSRPIKPSHLARIMVFTYARNNRGMVEVIAGRNLHNSWGQRYAELTSEWRLNQWVGVTGPEGQLLGPSCRQEYYEDSRGRQQVRSVRIDPPVMRNSGKGNRWTLKRPSGNRYTAINATNPNTIENRIFRGTVNYEGIMKNLDFVRASIAFCRPGTVSFKDLENPNVFGQFVAHNSKDYPHLYKFLVQFRLAPRKERTATN